MTRRERALWPDLERSERRELLRVFRAALARCGAPGEDTLAWDWCVLLAEVWLTTRQASAAAVREGLKRQRGRGRRPTAQAVDRRLKRQGLGVTTLDSMLRRLDELATARRKPASIAELAAARRAAQ